MSYSIYQRAVDVFGEDAQIGQLHEEMGELMQAINKYKRAPTDITRDDVIEETVDLMIMCEQMKCIFDHDNKFKDVMDYKLWRLGKTIDKEDEKQYTHGRLGDMLDAEKAEYDEQIERLIKVRLNNE